ncbi:MAG: DEAD/DEAH box helicase [Dehalococcoidia bacterium]|jgi:SNF2 family DNA or RNA helicase
MDEELFYGTLDFIVPGKTDSYRHRGNHWLIKGHQPALMASRVIPNSWANEVGERCVPDNIAAAEHIQWIMVRYPLKISSPEIWKKRVEVISEINKKRHNLRTLTENVTVDARFKGTLLAFQKKGLDFLLKTNGCALIADEMGLGKTVEALAYLVTIPDGFPCLIIAPLVTLVNWQREIERFISMAQGKPFSVEKIRTGKKKDLIMTGQTTFDGSDGKPMIYLINYDLVSKRRDDLAKIPFRTIIADECQHLRNPTSMKTKSARELVDLQTVRHRIGLSGTPCYNHGIEIWSICDFISPGMLGTLPEFRSEFIWGWDPKGSIIHSKRGALYEMLTESVMIRRRKLDVLKDLPDKTRYRQEIQIDQEYYKNEMRNNIKTLHEKLAAANARTDFKAIAETSAYQEFKGHERMSAGMAKVPYVVEFVKEMMENEEPLVIFCHHLSVHETLQQKLSEFKPVKIIGGQTELDRQFSIDSFQEGKTKLLIAGLRAGNVGISLTKANYVVFAELDWSPAIHRQAEDRLHRIGQKNAVFAYYLEGKGTLDEKIVGVLTDKTLELNEILGDANRDDEPSGDISLTEKNREFVKIMEKRFLKIPGQS